MNPAGSRNPAGFYWIIPQSRGIEKTRDLVNCNRGLTLTILLEKIDLPHIWYVFMPENGMAPFKNVDVSL